VEHSDYAVVLSTCGSRLEAETIAEHLVGDQTAACVNIIQRVRSIYAWEGKIERTDEELLIIKTRRALVDRVEETIKAHSSYDCPEVVVLPVTGGSEGFLRWINETTGGR
jgi:periplasmic divalent cation tolerance protein